ncbi:hypothetical protein CRE_11362 [Caenorhabditis remanei]|uniref:Uncharacterized protein n=1 Tax=Caenorhabditis remanei TaxID=31234 RepID=E3N0J6_CAERE|nr:hypothetical protein CRE_11362 [Caenorhabditis remanei]
MSSKTVLPLLINLSKHAHPSPTTFVDSLSCLATAFSQPKPLFQSNELLIASSAVSKSIHLLHSAIKQLDIGMNIDRRQDAQKDLSGLFYISQELENEAGLRELINSRHVKSIIGFIENTEGVEPENVEWEEVDLTGIPKSHYWWFQSIESNE